MRFKTVNTISLFVAMAGVVIACLNAPHYFTATLVASSILWGSALIASAIYEKKEI